MQILGEQSANINIKKRCSGCKKNQDEQMFIEGECIRSPCSNCRYNNKMRKKQSRDLLQKESEIFEDCLIEFEELADELLFKMDQYTSSYDKENLAVENVASFEFKRAIDISSLPEDPKNIADIIIETIQNADEYKWKYV